MQLEKGKDKRSLLHWLRTGKAKRLSQVCKVFKLKFSTKIKSSFFSSALKQLLSMTSNWKFILTYRNGTFVIHIIAGSDASYM